MGLGERGLSTTVILFLAVIIPVASAGVFFYGDWDEDGLRTYEEIFETSTPPLNGDPDQDGIEDGGR